MIRNHVSRVAPDRAGKLGAELWITSDGGVLGGHVRDDGRAGHPDGLVDGGRDPLQVLLVAQSRGGALAPNVLIDFSLG